MNKCLLSSVAIALSLCFITSAIAINSEESDNVDFDLTLSNGEPIDIHIAGKAVKNETAEVEVGNDYILNGVLGSPQVGMILHNTSCSNDSWEATYTTIYEQLTSPPRLAYRVTCLSIDECGSGNINIWTVFKVLPNGHHIPVEDIAEYKEYNVPIYAYRTVTFDANGGTGVIPSNRSYMADLTLPSTGYAKDGAELIGWNTKPDGSGTSYNLGEIASIKTNQTLYAEYGTEEPTEPETLEITSTPPATTIISGNTYEYTPTANLDNVTWSISNAPSWLAVSNGKVTGLVPAIYEDITTETYTLTATSGALTATQEVTINIEPVLSFTSVPTASMIVNPAGDSSD